MQSESKEGRRQVDMCSKEKTVMVKLTHVLIL